MYNKLTNCRTCGAEIAKTAKRCPNCGAQQHVVALSAVAIISVVTVFLVVFILLRNPGTEPESGRVAAATTSAKTTTSAGSSETEATTTAVPDLLGDWEITVDSFETKEAISAGLLTEHRADDGNLFVIAHLTIKNMGKEAATFLPLVALGDVTSAKITYKEYEYSSSTLLSMNNDDLHYKTLNPLTSAKGIVVFQMAKDIAESGELKLVLSNDSQSLKYDIK